MSLVFLYPPGYSSYLLSILNLSHTVQACPDGSSEIEWVNGKNTFQLQGQKNKFFVPLHFAKMGLITFGMVLLFNDQRVFVSKFET